MIRALLAGLADPPLDPSPDEARSRLRRELLDPQYHEQGVYERIVTGINRFLDRLFGAADGAPALSTAAALLVGVLLLVGLGLLLTRLRAAPRAAGGAGAVLTDEVVTAVELRARARRALAEERYEDAVVEGFRAVAVGQVERGLLEDRPGATAHEVGAAMAAAHPPLRGRVEAGALLFDLVRYGDRRVTREQALAVLALDDELVGSR